MIIYLDGPEKAGKSTLAKEIRNGFNSDHSTIVKWTGRARNRGFEYYPEFARGLISQDIRIWDRGWISESIYGKMLGEDRYFSQNPFVAEWYYGRALNGHGGKFIVLPHDRAKLALKRDDTDLPINPDAEYWEFYQYAKTWGYDILYNDYSKIQLFPNAIEARRSIFRNTHNLMPFDYIGPKNPLVTFVSEWATNESFSDPKPFYDNHSMKFFEMTGSLATREFGYANLDAWELVNCNKFIAVGERATKVIAKEIGYVPSIPDIWEMEADKTTDRHRFWNELNLALISHGLKILNEVKP